MNILQKISQVSTILLPFCGVAGFIFPTVSNSILPFLPNILFFLMFFTLLGIDQKTLFKRLFVKSTWLFALMQNVFMCCVVTGLAYLVGLRGELLLAVAALSATSPLFGSGAIVNAMGFDALTAMAKTIVATLIMPITLLIVLLIMASADASLDLAAYFKRLVIYIVCPIVLSVIVKQITPQKVMEAVYPKVAQCNVLLVLVFPLGLGGGFRETFDTNPSQALLLFAVANTFVAIVFVITYLLYKRLGKKRAIIASTVCTGRNMILTHSIAAPFTGSLFLPLVGAITFAMYGLPLVGKYCISRLDPDEQ